MNDNTLHGDLIKELRKRSKLSQKALAMKIGKTRTMVSHYESGKYKVPFQDKKLIRLCKQYAIDIISYSPDNSIKPKTLSQRELNRDALMALIDKVNFERKKRIADFVKSMIDEEVDSLINTVNDPGELMVKNQKQF